MELTGPGILLLLGATAPARHEMAPTIVVMPRIDTPAGLDMECVNGVPGQPKTDTWLSNDLPVWTARPFHVLRVRTACASIDYFRPDFAHGGHPDSVLTPDVSQAWLAHTRPGFRA